jgi:U1 small nuclear ribonucleoprotein
MDARTERLKVKLEAEKATWNPHEDANAEGNAFKTLFVGRLPYAVTSETLRREFDVYGPVKSVRHALHLST